MGGMSVTHWAVVCIAAMLLFGKGRLSSTMGDIGKGLRSFRQGLSEDEPIPARPSDHDNR